MEIQKGMIKEVSFQSRELGEELDILIYLPPSYSPLYKYSLLIAQDGKDYFQMGRAGRAADELLHNREIENVIIVGIPYKNVHDRRSKYHPEGDKQRAYIRFLAHELVPYLDAEYPTYQMGQGRILAGDSLGASVSLLASLEYPNTFGKTILQSPYVDESILEAARSFPTPGLLNIYHVIGTQETEVKTTKGEIEDFLTPNRSLSSILSDRGFQYFYEEFEGNHTWKYWQPDFKRALKHML